MGALTTLLISRQALAVGLVVLLGAGGGGYLWLQAHQPDTIPTTVWLNLRDGQSEVPLDQKLTFQASRPLQSATLEKGVTVSPAVEAGLSVAPDGRQFTITPVQPWADLTTYTVTLAPQRDAGGHPVNARSWHFRTTLVARVVALTAGEAQLADGGEIPLGTPLQLRFNSPMEGPSVLLTANGSALSLDWASDQLTAIIPAGELKAGFVELAIQAGAQDQKHRPLSRWDLRTAVVYHLSAHTTDLAGPALIQVPNDPSARDQSGLQAANLVFESVAEGNITRLSALFSKVPDEVGPVRSGRLISFKLARHYGALLFFSGLSKGSFRVFQKDPVPYVSDDTPGWFHRTNSRFPPNNLFISVEKVQAAEGAQGLAPNQPALGASAFNGDDARGATAPLHRSVYGYDPDTATYSKTEDGHRVADAALG
ncbi:MAG: DUF3048 domain-containing protein [Candidatus Dormibacteraeota bacterium]|uniref:DUF3048 domain-containing protein n=1 Tax=Candidatus Dormiibacter inghamiae TaxID=3127013 RepID=A0A934KBL7_9BACT|nr:DUF3048 domain-containing protein [Candidatus Dormibacteraeota bacterium]MBJ7605052.1 DUF3048 domain-containing protein [Candidatus Dormibacteraeota bacterium]